MAKKAPRRDAGLKPLVVDLQAVDAGQPHWLNGVDAPLAIAMDRDKPRRIALAKRRRQGKT